MRCTTKKYAKAFMEKGEIKFSTPSSWIEFGKIAGEGRGDILEGTIAFCSVYSPTIYFEIISELKQNSDLIVEEINERIYFRKSSDLSLPCFCLYLIKCVDFNYQEDGDYYKGLIPASYFKDFTDNSDNDINMLDEDKFAVVFITDLDLFISKVKDYLISIGVKEEELICKEVQYVDFEKDNIHKYILPLDKPPFELFIKDKRFEKQSEGRIIVNTDNPKIRKKLENLIEIGLLENICKMADHELINGLDFLFKIPK